MSIRIDVGTASVRLASEDTTVSHAHEARTTQQYVVDDLLHAAVRALLAMTVDGKYIEELDGLRARMLRHA